jgi:hypothetical protein
MDPYPAPDLVPADPAIFVTDLQGANINLFFLLITFEGTFTTFSKIKSHKEVTKQ